MPVGAILTVFYDAFTCMTVAEDQPVESAVFFQFEYIDVAGIILRRRRVSAAYCDMSGSPAADLGAVKLGKRAVISDSQSGDKTALFFKLGY